MGVLYLVLPILIAVVPVPGPSATVLADFSRMGKAAGEEIALVDKDGAVREGRLLSATADEVTMEFGSGRRVFAKAEIASAARLRDGVIDGIVRGVLLGTIMGAFASQGCESASDECARRAWFASMAIYGAIGWGLDAANKNQQPIYRAPTPAQPKPGVNFSLRF